MRRVEFWRSFGARTDGNLDDTWRLARIKCEFRRGFCTCISPDMPLRCGSCALCASSARQICFSTHKFQSILSSHTLVTSPHLPVDPIGKRSCQKIRLSFACHPQNRASLEHSFYHPPRSSFDFSIISVAPEAGCVF
jgi:hypothetical protein